MTEVQPAARNVGKAPVGRQLPRQPRGLDYYSTFLLGACSVMARTVVDMLQATEGGLLTIHAEPALEVSDRVCLFTFSKQ